MSFKDDNRSFQHLIKELLSLRDLNFKLAKENKTPFLFSEALLVCHTIERFLRIIPKLKANDNNTLFPLLKKALIAEETKFLQVRGDKSAEEFIQIIASIRNALFHSNYEQLSKEYNVSVNEYFGKFFASEIESLFKILGDMINQINPETGEVK